MQIIPAAELNYSIFVIRGQRVMLNTDLARLYGVTTRRLNEQVRRNPERFPGDFMFQLTNEEKAEVVANCDHLSNLKHSQATPIAFTEHGAVMLANVLNSPAAVEASIQVVRAFVKLRQVMVSHEEMSRRLDSLEKKYDKNFMTVFEAIRQLMIPPDPKKKQIGFHWETKKPGKKKAPAKNRAPAKKKSGLKKRQPGEKSQPGTINGQ